MTPKSCSPREHQLASLDHAWWQSLERIIVSLRGGEMPDVRRCGCGTILSREAR